jgi:hypothetical protein
MSKTSKPDLSPTIENKPLKLLWNIGPHLVCIIDKNIVEKLNVEEGHLCEQLITEDGNVLLKIRKFKGE